MSDLRLDGIGKRYDGKAALSALSFEVKDGELFAVLGPSGCGKTTALRIVAGFVEPDQGKVYFGGRDVTGLVPERRDAAMVFQSYALFPHLDVGENVAFGLAARKVAAGAVAERVKGALALVGLAGYERRDVGNLSGGEQQRVALARAIVVEPSILLLDEPMSNLDPKLRAGTRKDLRALQRRLGITTIYVTHDQDEALEMADRVAVLDRGHLVQVGTPRELYDRPADAFVATFVGAANVLTGRVASRAGEEATVAIGPSWRELRTDGRGAAVGEAVRLAIRPESLSIAADSGGAGAGESLGTGVIRAVDFQGPTIEISVTMPDGIELRVVTLNAGMRTGLDVGTTVGLTAPREKLVVLRERA